MALFARVAALFRRRAPRPRPRQTYSTAPEREMAHMDSYATRSFALNGGAWEYLTRKEIAAANQESVAIMHSRLDAVNAAVPRQTTVVIGMRDVGDFVVLDTPHQMAIEFGLLLDSFNTDEDSFVF